MSLRLASALGAIKYPTVTATNLGFVSMSDDSIVALNNRSLGFRAYYGTYWPRHLYGRVARELANQGAKTIAYDILFGELHPDDAPVQGSGSLTNLIESDEYFARLIKKAGNVLLASEHGIPPLLFRTNALAMGDISADKDLDGVLRRAKAFQYYTNWHRLFQQVGDDPEMGVDLSKAVVEPRRLILPRAGADAKKPNTETNQLIIFPLDEQGRFDLADFDTNLPPQMQRYQPPFTRERVWHMGIELAAQQLKLDLDKAQADLEHGRITLRGASLERTIPVDANGYFYINWSVKVNDKAHLAQAHVEDVLRQGLTRQAGDTNGLDQRMRGKLVVIGSTATGNDLTDRGATPLEKDTFLVSKHWNVANSVITGQFIRSGGLAVEVWCIILAGTVAAALTWRLNTLRALLAIAAVLVIYVALTLAVFVEFRYWLPLVLPVGGGLLTTHGCLLAYLVVFERAEQRRVRSVFSKVVSPGVVHELLRLEKLPLKGARRKLTVFFSDIRGFTEMTDVNQDQAAEYIKQNRLTGAAAETYSEQQAGETLDTVNLYLSLIAEKVIQNNGTIDKFIGDCVMAFWGAPTANPQHAVACVRAAIDAQRAVYRLNQTRQIENRRREEENVGLRFQGEPLLPMQAILAVGCGINTGTVTVGLMGSDEHGLNYTVFGREVNLASRLESVSGRGRIIISEATLAEIIQDDPELALACVKLEPVQVKGIRNAVQIYEVPWRVGE